MLESLQSLLLFLIQTSMLKRIGWVIRAKPSYNLLPSLVTVIYTYDVKLMGHEIEQDFSNQII